MRAVAKLCDPGAHRNIVAVLQFGKFPGSYFYFLDMELCDLNLDAYIHRRWTENIRLKSPHLIEADELPESERLAQVGVIAKDIVTGVAFIHSHKEIHRDLKPQNGTYFFRKTLMHSPLFLQRRRLEDRRFRTNSARHRQSSLYNSLLQRNSKL